MPEYRDKMCKLSSVRMWAVYLLSILVCLVLVTGCDSGPKKMADPKASLERLAEEYWNKRLIDRDYKTTYKMESDEGSVPFEEYLQRVHNEGKIGYTSIKTKEVRIDKDKGFVKLTITYLLGAGPQFPKEMSTPIHDTWILKSNQWKHLPQKK